MTNAGRRNRCRAFGRFAKEAEEDLRERIRKESLEAVRHDPLAWARRHLYRSSVNSQRKAPP